MRILFLSIEYPPESPNGIGSYAVEIGAALAQRGHEVHVLSCIPGQQVTDYHDGAVVVHRRTETRAGRFGRLLGGSRAEARLRHAVACWQEARALGIEFDVIETPEWMAEGLLFALARRPVVTFLHSPLALTSPFSAGQVGRDLRMANALERLVTACARAVTAPSHLVVERLRAQGWLARRDVEVIRYPISPTEWTAERPVADTAPVTLFTGRLERLKAPEVLVDAMAQISDQIPEAAAWLAGRTADEVDGRGYGEWLADRIATLAAPCRLLGEQRREAVQALVSSARVIAVPSRYESFSYSGLEALAAGRPVVCTSATGLAEIVQGTGAGQVVPPDDPQALASGLRPYLEDAHLAARAGEKGRALAARLCSAPSVAAEREKVYERVTMQ
jgi:glycosyltransferase involved in cell wall biosynthesis